MPGFMPGIHALKSLSPVKDVDGRNESGHDVDRVSIMTTIGTRCRRYCDVIDAGLGAEGLGAAGLAAAAFGAVGAAGLAT
jgi:hypothetical protein